MTQENQEQHTESAVSARPVRLPELSAGEATGASLLTGNLALIAGVKARVEVVVGGADIKVGELMALRAGSLIPLDESLEEPLTVLLDGQAIARGHLVVVGDKFGIRVSEIAPVAGSA